jgi:hypothetical protein
MRLEVSRINRSQVYRDEAIAFRSLGDLDVDAQARHLEPDARA